MKPIDERKICRNCMHGTKHAFMRRRRECWAYQLVVRDIDGCLSFKRKSKRST